MSLRDMPSRPQTEIREVYEHCYHRSLKPHFKNDFMGRHNNEGVSINA